jgi:Predicted membrane protein involved in D-alanine export
MIFSSIAYFVFFPIVFAIYWMVRDSWKKVILLIASYVFYMSFLPTYGLLLFGLTIANYVFGLLLQKFRQQVSAILFLAVAFNVGALTYYKYAAFLVGTFISQWTALHELSSLVPPPPVSDPVLDILMPLGISFFVFEFIHYCVDVKRTGKAIGNPLDFFVFASFFPSQIAGPIKRYQDFDTELNKPKKLNREDMMDGLTLLARGLFKKIALADTLAPFIAAGTDSVGTLGSCDAWTLILAFTLRVYFDFSGYTDMGIGSARMLGIKLPTNFNHPFLASKNMIEFWQRWHITLSTWLRDYVLMPIAGFRGSKLRFHFATMVTMTLCGLWHGADWHFVVWGALQGAVLVVTREQQELIRKHAFLKRIHAHPLATPPAILSTFVIWMLMTPYFLAPSVEHANQLLVDAFRSHRSNWLAGEIWHSPFVVAFVVYLIWGLLFAEMPALSLPKLHPVRRFLAGTSPRRLAFCLCSLVGAVCLSPLMETTFIYFKF